MKKITFLLITAMTLFSSCKIVTSKDLGPETTRTIAARDFNKLDISISSDVEYIPSDTFSVTITAPEKAFDRIVVNVSDSTLSIENKQEEKVKGVRWIIDNGSGATASKIVVRAPYLACAHVTGSASFTCNATMAAHRLELAVAGSGEMNITNIKADIVETSVAGSGEVNIANMKAGVVKTNVAGSGEVKASLAQVTTTSVGVQGSGEVSLKLNQCGNVLANVAGSGEIHLSGSALSLETTVAGSGNIDTNNLKLTK